MGKAKETIISYFHLTHSSSTTKVVQLKKNEKARWILDAINYPTQTQICMHVCNTHEYDKLVLKLVMMMMMVRGYRISRVFNAWQICNPLFYIGKTLIQKHSPLVMIVLVLSECPKDKINICAVTNPEFHGDPLCDSVITRENANELYSNAFPFIAQLGKPFLL